MKIVTITMSEDDLELLVENAVEKALTRKGIIGRKEKRWLTEKETMDMLAITSKTKLWQMRKDGLIVFTQPSRKIILYCRLSIENYLEKHKHDAFNL